MSNVVSPILVYVDRLLIGALLSMTAVAYYATPYEVVTKLLIIPGAIMGVMFPAFSTAISSDRQRARFLFDRVSNYIFVAVFPAVLIVVTFAHEGLSIWLGAEFAENSTPVLQLLAVGVLLNSLAQVPFGLVQGAGRPDITAKLHVAELVVYLPFLWLMLQSHGIIGAAIAWTARMAIDTLLLFVAAEVLTRDKLTRTIRSALVAGLALLALGVAAFLTGLLQKTIFLVVLLSAFSVISWYKILLTEEKKLIRASLSSVLRTN